MEAAQQYTKIQASAETSGNTIIVLPEECLILHLPTLTARCPRHKRHELHVYECAECVHTVQVRYNARMLGVCLRRADGDGEC